MHETEVDAHLAYARALQSVSDNPQTKQRSDITGKRSRFGGRGQPAGVTLTEHERDTGCHAHPGKRYTALNMSIYVRFGEPEGLSSAIGSCSFAIEA